MLKKHQIILFCKLPYLRPDFIGEGFRKKFRTSELEKGETYPMFETRLKGYLNRWIELSEVEKSYGGLLELVLTEQLRETAPDMLKVFLKERDPKSWTEALSLAENYKEAHAHKHETGRPNYSRDKA